MILLRLIVAIILFALAAGGIATVWQMYRQGYAQLAFWRVDRTNSPRRFFVIWGFLVVFALYVAFMTTTIAVRLFAD